MRFRRMSAPPARQCQPKEPEMMEFTLTARGLYFRFQLAPETLVSILIFARLCQPLL